MLKGNKGLKNNGNTCYLNAVIQCLSHIDILSNDEFKNQTIKYKRGSELLEEWIDIQNKIWLLEDNNIVDPINLINIFNKKCKKDNIYFESFNQNDASEFLEIFLDFMHKDLSRKININIKGEPKTQLDKLYYNNLKTQQKNFNNNYSYIIYMKD